MHSRVTCISVIDVRVVEGPAVETLAPLWGEVTGRPFRAELMRLYRERAESVLDDFCTAAECTGLEPVDRRVEIGVAEDAILDQAAHADLLVMGRRGEHAGLGRGALGATVLRILHRAPCTVLVGGKTSSAEYAGVTGITPRLPLVAWDRSQGGRRALDLAVWYAAATSGQLRVVHAGGESADKGMDEVQGSLSACAVSWESARLDEDPARAVEEARARWNADCLFMGSFGRGRIRGLLFGSHTSRILERIGVPVFVTT